MKRLFLLILVLCLALCGCGQGNEETTAPTTEPADPPTQTTAPPTEPSTEPSTEPATEPTEPGPTNPLSGEPVEQEITDRPYGVMINNHKEALPHCGISDAEVIYETLVEGGMTRYMAIFSDPEQGGPIGSVRSARPPHVDIIQAYDGIYASARGHGDVVSVIKADGVSWLDGLSYDGSYFYRNQERRNAGVSLEHTMFIDGPDLEALAQHLGIETARRKESDYGFHFDETLPFEGETANEILISFQTSQYKTTTCNYNQELGAYTLYQQGQDYIDGNTGQLVEFRNVLILEGKSYVMSNGIHVYVETVGEGPGYYARDGKLIPITWSRESKSDAFVYTDLEGNPINMGVGKTYIAIIADGAPVEYE